jgi:ankyrin repeat protein
LQAGADPLVRNAEGQTAIQLVTAPDTIRVLRDAMVQRRLEIEICHAVAKGNLQPLRTVLNNPQRKFNPNILDESNSMSLLMLACSQGDVELVKTLIAAGADVNYISANRRSVLHIAVDHNQPAVVTALLQAGANPMQQAANSAMPLHDAVWSNRVECVKALLPAYKSINYSPDGAHNGLPLNLAIDRGWTTIVQLFIDTGMDLNTCKYGTPPLIHAAASGKANIVQQLLRAGADVNARAKNGETAKDVAAPAVRHLF